MSHIKVFERTLWAVRYIIIVPVVAVAAAAIGVVIVTTLEALLLHTATAPVYQRIAARSLQLRQLGVTPTVIAKHLGVSDKTATKAIAWIRRPGR